MVERRAGIEGSGMLRLASEPSKYVCVRKEKYTESALQAIEKESTGDFKYRCSFFLQKLRDENVGTAVNKSIVEGGHKKSNIATSIGGGASSHSASSGVGSKAPVKGKFLSHFCALWGQVN